MARLGLRHNTPRMLLTVEPEFGEFFFTSTIWNFPYFLSYVSLFQWLCIYILWRLHRTWKPSCLPTFQIFQFQTLKYVQLKFFHYFWRRISGHLKNNYVFTWVWHPFYLFPLSHEFTIIFLLLLYLLTASASRWLSTHTHISLPLHSPTIISGKKTLKNKKLSKSKAVRGKISISRQ